MSCGNQKEPYFSTTQGGVSFRLPEGVNFALLLPEKAGVKTHQLNQVLLILREKGVVFNGEAVRKHVAGKRLLSYELGIGFRGSQIGLAEEGSEANFRYSYENRLKKPN